MHLARLCLAAIAVAIAAAVTTQLVQAQSLTDRQKGRVMAREVCAECHAVGRRSTRSPNPRSPSFFVIASTPGMTEIALNVILHTSHRYMPNIVLNDEQSAAIIAYILSLRK
jgi:mono/diheme cytochrome c family protein